MDTVI